MTQADRDNPLQAACETIVAGDTAPANWLWDDHFQAALVVIDIEASDTMRSLLKQSLPLHWSPENIVSAPRPVQEIVERLGGIQSGQEFFANDTGNTAILYAAWWPWGNGTSISVRVSAASTTLTQAEESQLRQNIRLWFGL